MPYEEFIWVGQRSRSSSLDKLSLNNLLVGNNLFFLIKHRNLLEAFDFLSAKAVNLIQSRRFSLCKPLTKRQNFTQVEIESSCRGQNKCDPKFEYCFGKERKHCGKRRKCWSPTFSPFPELFSKAFFLRVVKSLDCVLKG